MSDQKTTHLFAIRESKKNQFVEHSSRPNNVHATHRWVVRRVPFKRLLANASCMLNWLSMTCIIRSKISYFISFYHPTNIGYLDHGKINLSKVVSVYTKTLARRHMHMKSTLWVSTPVRAAAANESWWLQSFHFQDRSVPQFSLQRLKTKHPRLKAWNQAKESLEIELQCRRGRHITRRSQWISLSNWASWNFPEPRRPRYGANITNI